MISFIFLKSHIYIPSFAIHIANVIVINLINIIKFGKDKNSTNGFADPLDNENFFIIHEKEINRFGIVTRHLKLYYLTC